MNRERQAKACDIFAKLHEEYSDHHDQHGRIDNDSQPFFVSDLLADLRHYCDAHGLDFEDCDRRGHDHYTNEQETTT
jgi:hypothetical protein